MHYIKCYVKVKVLNKILVATLWLHDLCLKILTVLCNELRSFKQSHPTNSNYIWRATDIAEVGTIFKVFSYDAVLSQYSNLLLFDDKRSRANGIPNFYKNLDLWTWVCCSVVLAAPSVLIICSLCGSTWMILTLLKIPSMYVYPF